MIENKLKVGIAGLGVVGKRRMELVRRHENLSLVAVCDQHDTCEDGINGTVKYYTDLMDLMKEDLDILFVCLPNDIAAEVTISGLKKGFHVFCEKPPGKCPEDIEKVRAAEKKYTGLKLMYGFNHRHHASIEDALVFVNSTEAGRLINIKGTYGKSLIANKDSEWRANRAKAGGGILLDQGIHMIDIFRLFAGEFNQIYSIISDDFWNYDVEDNAYALMKSDSGVVAILHSSATQWVPTFQIELTFASASLILSGILSGSMSYAPEKITVIHRSRDANRPAREVCKAYTVDDSWWKEICIFIDAILYDREITNGSSRDALKSMELVYKIYKADSLWKNKYDL